MGWPCFGVLNPNTGNISRSWGHVRLPAEELDRRRAGRADREEGTN